MKVIQVLQAFYPCQIWGGPPQNVLTLSKGLQSRGHQVEIITTNILDHDTYMKPQSFQRTWEGIPVTYLKAYWLGRRSNSVGFILVPTLWNYHHLLRDADIVHIHGYRHFLMVGTSLLARTYGVPYIIQARGALPAKLGRSKLKQLFDLLLGRFILRNVAGAVALNDKEMSDYKRLGVPEGKIVKILNPMDPTLCSVLPSGKSFRRRYEISDQDKIILFLSRLHKKKGLDLLIRAFSELESEDTKLCIVGPDDGFLSKAQDLIEKLDLTHSTVITGPLYGRAKFEAYRAADVYVLPTRGYEGLPTTILEACYSGVPIVVTRTTEVSKIVDGKIGIAVNYDKDELKNALKRLLDEPQLRQSFSIDTRHVLQKYFNLDNALDLFENFYSKCMVNSRG